MVSSHNIPFHFASIHVHNCSDPVSWAGLHIDVFLFFLFADWPIISIIADTVHLFETELLFFIFVCNNPDNYIVVFDLFDMYIKIELSLASKIGFIKNLIGRAV